MYQQTSPLSDIDENHRIRPLKRSCPEFIEFDPTTAAAGHGNGFDKSMNLSVIVSEFSNDILAVDDSKGFHDSLKGRQDSGSRVGSSSLKYGSVLKSMLSEHYCCTMFGPPSLRRTRTLRWLDCV